MLTAESGLVSYPMTFTVKTEADTLPAAVRQQAGIKLGDMLEFKVSGGVVTIIPKLPTADDEYTPAQRAIVDAQLAEGLEDIRKGRVSPKFDTVDEMLALLKAGHKSKPRQKKPHSRGSGNTPTDRRKTTTACSRRSKKLLTNRPGF